MLGRGFEDSEAVLVKDEDEDEDPKPFISFKIMLPFKVYTQEMCPLVHERGA